MIHVRRTCTSYRCTAYMYHSINTPLLSRCAMFTSILRVFWGLTAFITCWWHFLTVYLIHFRHTISSIWLYPVLLQSSWLTAVDMIEWMESYDGVVKYRLINLVFYCVLMIITLMTVCNYHVSPSLSALVRFAREFQTRWWLASEHRGRHACRRCWNSTNSSWVVRRSYSSTTLRWQCCATYTRYCFVIRDISI